MSVFAGVLAGLGGLSSLLSSMGIGKKDVPFDQLNPYTSQSMDKFSNLLNLSDSRMNQLMGSAESTANRLGGVQGSLQDLFGQMSGMQGPSVNQGYNLFNQRSGGLLDLGQEAAERFTQPYRERGEEVANRRADQAAQNIMSQFGGAGFSGAAQGAASGAASDVFADYERDLASMFGQIGSGISGQALAQERGLAEQAPQQQYANQMNQLLQLANLQQAKGASLGQQSGLLGSMAGQYGSRSNNLMNNIGMLSGPQFQERVQESPFGAVGATLGGLGSMFSNPDFSNLFQNPSTPAYTPTYNNMPYQNQMDYYDY